MTELKRAVHDRRLLGVQCCLQSGGLRDRQAAVCQNSLLGVQCCLQSGGGADTQTPWSDEIVL